MTTHLSHAYPHLNIQHPPGGSCTACVYARVYLAGHEVTENALQFDDCAIEFRIFLPSRFLMHRLSRVRCIFFTGHALPLAPDSITTITGECRLAIKF